MFTGLGAVITLVSAAAKLLTPAPAPPVDEQLRLLAEESRKQWAAAADERRLLHPAPLPIWWRLSTAPVAGPASAATYARFDPLPGLTAVPSSRLYEGDKDALHRVYGGLPSGRLLLIGPPGSGKSAAAILLLLDALRYREHATREDQHRIPVPVMFTLHGWQPGNGESVTDWMAAKLAETYPMFRSRAGRRQAADLLERGRIAVFLDGLDEIPEARRPGVLRALTRAPFRLVLLTRIDEAKQAASHGPLAGAVALELQPVKPTDAAAYLLQSLVNPPPAPWQQVSDDLTSAHRRSRASALSQALTTPLNLGLLRDVYGPTDPIDELLNAKAFPTAASIENHLLDHAITAAYSPRDGDPRPRYTVETARCTLGYLATRLTERSTRDLAWWHSPTWTKHSSRIIRVALGSWLTRELVAMVVLLLTLTGERVFGSLNQSTNKSQPQPLDPDLVTILKIELISSSVLILIVGLAVGFRRRSPIIPRRVRPTYRRIFKGARLRFAVGFAIGFVLVAVVVAVAVAVFERELVSEYGVVGVVIAGLVDGVLGGLVVGLVVGLVAVVVGGVIAGLISHAEVDGSLVGPADTWRHDRNAGLVLVLVAGGGIGLVVGFATGNENGPVYGLVAGLTYAVTLGLVVGFVSAAAGGPGSAFMETVLVCVQLKFRHKIPLRLIPFLEDARKKHLLRTVGSVYQFRHAKLQDRLAETPQAPLAYDRIPAGFRPGPRRPR